MLPILVKQTVLRSTMLVLGKCIGLVGRVILTRMLGAEGIGLYQIVYSFFGMILTILTGGLPTTLALFTTKQPTRGWKAFQYTSFFMGGLGASVAYLVYLYAENIAPFLGNTSLHIAIRCLVPALFAVPLLQLLRGYMQGVKSYNVISISELVEQSVRITFMIVLAGLCLPKGIIYALGASLYGTTIGAISAFVIITSFVYLSKKPNIIPIQSSRQTGGLALLLRSSIAIGCTKMLVPMSEFIDSLLIPHRLQTAGYSLSESISMYGVVTGMAAVVAYMPTIVTGSLSHTVTMRIAADYEQRQSHGQYVAHVLKFVWVWGIVSSLFLFLFAAVLSKLIFSTNEAVQSIRGLAAIPLIVGLREITTSILWAQERQRIPLIGLIGGIGVSIALQYFILAIPGAGYTGAVIGIITLEITAVLLNMRALRHDGILLFKWDWIGWDLLLFSILMLVVFTPFIHGNVHVVWLALNVCLYWITVIFIIGWRYRAIRSNL